MHIYIYKYRYIKAEGVSLFRWQHSVYLSNDDDDDGDDDNDKVQLNKLPIRQLQNLLPVLCKNTDPSNKA
jgi:hypothetical protein